MAGAAPPRESTPFSAFTASCAKATEPPTSRTASTMRPRGSRTAFNRVFMAASRSFACGGVCRHLTPPSVLTHHEPPVSLEVDRNLLGNGLRAEGQTTVDRADQYKRILVRLSERVQDSP